MSIEVKVMEIPGAIVNVALESGATVADALQAAKMTLASGRSLKVNGIDGTHETVLTDNSTIAMSVNAKGNK